MKNYLFIIWAMMLAVSITAQVPQGINYQTVIRSNDGSLVTEQDVAFRFSIISGSPTGTLIYSEAHNTTTNELGLVNLVIGNGTPESGTFTAISWANDAHYLMVEVDPEGGVAFQEMGTSQLMSVPYALSAGNASTSMAQLTDVDVSGVVEGQVLKWNGTEWLPANDVGGGNGDNWGTQTIQSNNAFTGSGTTASPLALAQQGATNGQVLKWNGTAWLPAGDIDTNTDAQTLTISGNTVSITGGNSITLPTAAGDNWGSQTIQSNNAFTGSGTTASPLTLAQQGATNGQVLKWNGTTWLPASDANTDTQTLSISGNTVSITGGNSITLPTAAGDNWGTQTVQSNNAFTGSGTTANPLALAQQGATSGQVLKWNGTAWLPASDTDTNTDTQTLSISGNTVSITGGNSITLPTAAGDNWGTQTIQSNNAFTGSGTTASPLALAQQGATSGQVLKWNGTAWLPAADIDTNTDAQTLTISGNTVSITGGNSITLPASSGWGLTGNTGTNPANHFIGTTDNQPLVFKVNNAAKAHLTTKGQLEILNTGGSVFIGEGAGTNDDLTDNRNVFIGKDAGTANTTGVNNTIVGFQALYANNVGFANSANGYEALRSNTNGNSNTAIGALALRSNTTGSWNTANGAHSLYTNTTGAFNTALGEEAMYFNNSGSHNTATGCYALQYNTTGGGNTANGISTLSYNTTGGNNSANGSYSLQSNTTGSNNSAFGSMALGSNTTGHSNVAVGIRALYSNTTGSNLVAIGDSALFNQNVGVARNTAVGSKALYSNTIGSNNTANGFSALNSNTTAYGGTAIGALALYSNTTGLYNTATGWMAMEDNTTGYYNTANGVNALNSNLTGSFNVAIGSFALGDNTTGDNNTATGFLSLRYNVIGLNNTAIGRYAGFGATGVSFGNCTFVGYNSYPTVNRANVTMLGANIANGQNTSNNQVLLGSTAITQLRAQVSGITTYSDARFKNNVRHDVKGLDFINRLQPVTYNESPEELHKIWGTPDSLLREINHSEINNTRFIGFIAQDVAKAAKESGFDFPGIDEPRNEKEVYSLRYTDFIMPLVMGMKEQQQIIEQQQQEIDELKKLVHALLEKEK